MYSLQALCTVSIFIWKRSSLVTLMWSRNLKTLFCCGEDLNPWPLSWQPNMLTNRLQHPKTHNKELLLQKWKVQYFESYAYGFGLPFLSLFFLSLLFLSLLFLSFSMKSSDDDWPVRIENTAESLEVIYECNCNANVNISDVKINEILMLMKI